MSKTVFLIFNHTLTQVQEEDARSSLAVDRVVPLPPELQELWSSIPPDLPQIAPVLEPIKSWLRSESRRGDYVLIQGDFGATYLMVRFAAELGLIPVYSTTRRVASEEILPDGTVRRVHHFSHVIFRRYEV
jgi:hypothetical protein